MNNKIVSLSLIASCLVGCGYSSVNNELVGQPKRTHNQTPVFCDDRTDVEVSLGVMRGGIGSISTHDTSLTVPNQKDVETLNQAIKDGKLVKIIYNTKRAAWCWEEEVVVSVNVVDEVVK